MKLSRSSSTGGTSAQFSSATNDVAEREVAADAAETLEPTEVIATPVETPSMPVASPKRRRYRGPIATCVIGLGIAVVSGAAALAFWLQIDSSGISMLTDTVGWAARIAGLSVDAGDSESTPLWITAGFVLALAACGFGLFMASFGTIWVALRGARHATDVASPVARQGVDKSVEVSRRGAASTKEISNRGISKARALKSAGSSRKSAWLERRDERKELE